jgi:hypothetical protein
MLFSRMFRSFEAIAAATHPPANLACGLNQMNLVHFPLALPPKLGDTK